MSDKELVDSLKVKGLESFGTKGQKMERLKKHFGITEEGEWKKKTEVKSSCVKEVEKMRKKREERRANDNTRRRQMQELKIQNEAEGKFGDVEYELMISEDRLNPADKEQNSMHKKDDIDVIIRKRPIFEKELVKLIYPAFRRK